MNNRVALCGSTNAVISTETSDNDSFPSDMLSNLMIFHLWGKRLIIGALNCARMRARQQSIQTFPETIAFEVSAIKKFVYWL